MRKGGFRNQARKQETRNRTKFNFRKQQIKKFQFYDNGNVKDESKETVKDLILFSKKVWLTNKVMKDCYEGMYGFIDEKHFSLVKNSTTIYETNYPLIWQFLKTTEEGKYTRQESVKYLKGKTKPVSALLHLSSIAWNYLDSYFNTYTECINAKHIKRFIKNREIKEFLDKLDKLQSLDDKKFYFWLFFIYLKENCVYLNNNIPWS